MSIIRVERGKVDRIAIAAPTAPNKNQQPKLLKGGLVSSTNRIPVLKPRQLIALDTETTGLDFWHGCRPFFVSMLWEDGRIKFWQWEEYIDPLTRIITPPQKDLDEIAELLTTNDFILHNTKIDVRALESFGLPRINLASCHDTLIGSHVLCSNESHGLKDQALQYLDISDGDQKLLQEATNKARAIARSMGWTIAQSPEEGQPNHPHYPATRSSPKEGWWVMDTWLPRAVALKKKYLPNHPWWSLLKTYGLRDVERTYGLHMVQMEELHKDHNSGLLACYVERLRNLEALYVMENNGATISLTRTDAMDLTFATEANDREQVCYTLLGKLPAKVSYTTKGAKKITPVEPNLNSSAQIQYYLFKKLGLTPGKHTKSSTTDSPNYATDKVTLSKLLLRFDSIIAAGRKLTTNQLKAKQFINDLLGYRKREKSRDYLSEYRLRALPIAPSTSSPVPPKKLDLAPRPTKLDDWGTLHFWFNPTGTDTTRASSSQPNGQNIGKGEKRDAEGNLIEDFNLRKAFGPMPGREWYSFDYSNIELRLFAYESGDANLIEAFTTGYSVHLIFAEAVYPEQFANCRQLAIDSLINSSLLTATAAKSKATRLSTEVTRLAGDLFKKYYESSYYQWCKNGNFALIYGAGEGKADDTYHVSGAFDLIRNRLPLIDELMARKNHEARTYGYVTLRPGCEYRLYVPHDRPHVAVNYFVQGRAGWCMVRALNRVHKYLCDLNRSLGLTTGVYDGERWGSKPDASYKMILTIHDELNFDFPIHPRNLETVIPKIKHLMELSGTDVQVPTPVEIERHTANWGEGDKLKL